MTFTIQNLDKMNKKYNIERGGKEYAAKQKTKGFKKLLFQSKRQYRATSTKCFDSRKTKTFSCRKHKQH